MPQRFVSFGPAHLAAIGLAVGVPLILAAIVRTTASARLGHVVRWSLAGFLIATYLLWYGLLYSRGWMRLGNMLPMHLCDWAAIAALVTLLRPNQRSYELAYFWGLTGTLQATLTPELADGFPDLRFVVFFAFHGGVIAAVLYLTLGARLRPLPSSLPRAVAWTLFYGAVAGTIDGVFGVNFGFLRAKPVDPSALDLLAPWPWYIVEMVPIGIALILLLYAPFAIGDRQRAILRRVSKTHEAAGTSAP